MEEVSLQDSPSRQHSVMRQGSIIIIYIGFAESRVIIIKLFISERLKLEVEHTIIEQQSITKQLVIQMVKVMKSKENKLKKYQL